MKFQETLFRLERLDQLIRMKATGDPKTLAARLEISERSLYNLLDNLRGLGAEPEYSHAHQSYFYPNGKGLGIKVKPESDKDLKGGYKCTSWQIEETISIYSNSAE